MHGGMTPIDDSTVDDPTHRPTSDRSGVGFVGVAGGDAIGDGEGLGNVRVPPQPAVAAVTSSNAPADVFRIMRTSPAMDLAATACHVLKETLKNLQNSTGTA
jgi:hypothetical protein